MKCKSENVSSFVQIIYISKKQFATMPKSILCKKKNRYFTWRILNTSSIFYLIWFPFFGNKFWWASISLKIWLECQWFSKSLWIFFPLNIYSFFLVRPLKVILWTFFSVWKKLFFEERFALRISMLGTKK